ncbi:MAG TPA: aldo/keto reductase [Steroidobacteraceae bacterium]|nr:aldo/keto reductase [Steroidobacteraceae bacterium]
MIKRRLGNSTLEVAPLAFGGNVFGWTVDEPTSFRLLDAFVAAGFNLIDTANTYSRWVPGNKGGESETIIGSWLRQRPGVRDKVIIATKVGMDLGPGRTGLSKAVIRRELEHSLKLLNTDHIDLYQSHTDDAETPLEETLEAFSQLIQQGKVRAIGASNYTARRLREALKVSAARQLPRYESIQPEYNLYHRDRFEGELADLCRSEGLGVIPYYALASGFLTGKYRSEADFGKSPRGQAVKKMLDDRGRRILATLDQVGREISASPAEISLAWLLAHGVTAPIASATNIGQLQELMRGATLELPPEAVALLDKASAPS